MFTGIVEARGTVAELRPSGAVRRLVITTELEVEALPLGASIAVDGVCLTVVERAKGRFSADLGPETLACTTLGALELGARVHLERPLNLGDALGGHLVAGHVDGVGELTAREPRGQALELEIAAPPAMVPTLVTKGSIAVDGVSLTVNAIEGNRFRVTLIPHTLAVTGLGEKPAGGRLNLEADLIAKSIDRMLAARLGAGAEPGGAFGAAPLGAASHQPAAPAGLSLETLRKHGYAR
jgi:riboflavin synthase